MDAGRASGEALEAHVSSTCSDVRTSEEDVFSKVHDAEGAAVVAADRTDDEEKKEKGDEGAEGTDFSIFDSICSACSFASAGKLR